MNRRFADDETASRPITLQPWLAHFCRHVPVVRADRGAEGVHQLRIAIARIRVWLELGGWRILHDDLRELRRIAGAVRDVDVRLGYVVPSESDYASALVAERGRAQTALASALEAARVERVVAALRNLPPVSPRRARRVLRTFAHEAVRRGRSLEWDHYAALHAFRRIVRRVRFSLEWLGRSAPRFVEAQKRLGDACDAWIDLRGVARLPLVPRGYEREQKRRLTATTDLARRSWHDCRTDMDALT